MLILLLFNLQYIRLQAISARMDGVRITDIITKYDGSGDLETWFEKLKLGAKLKGIDDIGTLLPLFLEGPAFRLFQHLPDGDKASHESVIFALRQSFGLTACAAYNKFICRKQNHDETLDHFLSDLKSLAKCITSDAGDAWVACQFLNGLPQDIQDTVRAMHGAVLNLDDVLSCAKQVQAGLHTTSVNVGYAAASKCFRCGLSGHIARNCRRQLNNQTDRLCFKCNKPGHIARFCQGNSQRGEATSAAPSASPREQ